MFWTIFFFFGPFFFCHFIGGKQTISTQGGVGCNLSVLGDGWEADCFTEGGLEDKILIRREGWEVVVLIMLLINGVFTGSYKLL